jgi:hypothetical protein
VYIACCERTLADDCMHLLGAGGFAVVGAERYDHFAGCAGEHVGAALLLRRRPPTLLLPVGPAGSGKTTLCSAIVASLPPGAAAHVERDALFALARVGRGLAAAKREAAATLDEMVGIAAAAGAQLVVIDSCNASRGGRARYAALLPDRSALLLATFEGADRDLLVDRVRRLRIHPTFPEEEEAQAAALDATLAAMEWPDAADEGAVVLRCDPADGAAALREIVGDVFTRVLWPCSVAGAETPLSLTTLPEDLLLCVLGATESGCAVAASARTCRALQAACSCDKLWQSLCLSTWPHLQIARHAAPVHLRSTSSGGSIAGVLPPVDSWSGLFRARVTAAAPAGWRDLLPLYDKSTLVATQRDAGWVVEVGLLLRRITTMRARHGLPLSRLAYWREAHKDLLPHRSESFSWAKTMQYELLSGIDEIMAEANKVLNPTNEEMLALLEYDYRGVCGLTIEAVDALEAISTVLDTFPGAPWLIHQPGDALASDAARRLRDLKDELRTRREFAI